MKRAVRTDFYREVKNSFSRFMSIFLIVCLGVAFFAGIRAASPDMRLSANKLFQETNLMDIRVLGSLGLTEEDVAAIAAVDGVETVMPQKAMDVLCETSSTQLVLRFMSYPDTLNLIIVHEGRMPENSGECLVDDAFLDASGYQIGDTFTVKSGSEDELSDILVTDTYRIVGVGTTSYYLSLERGSSTIGSGALDAFVVVPKDDFSLEYYTDIYVLAKDSGAYVSYSDEYDDYIESIADRIEAIADERCEIRYTNVYVEAQEKITDGEKELSDAKKELADAEDELADARKKVTDGEEELTDAEEEFADAKKKYEDGKAEYNKGKKELVDGEKELADAWQEILDAKAELDDGEQQLADAKKQLDDGLLAIMGGTEKLRDGEAQIAAGEAQLQAKEAELASGEAQLLEKQQQFAQLTSALSMIGAMPEDTPEAAMMKFGAISGVLSSLGVDPSVFGGDCGAALAAAGAAASAAENELSQAAATIADGKGQLADAKNLLESQKKELAEGWDKIYEAGYAYNTGKEEYEENLKKWEDGKKEYEDGLAEYLDGKKEWEDGQKELADAKKKLSDGETELADGEVKLADARAELEDGKKKLADGEKEFADAKAEADEKIADGEEKLTDAKQKLQDLSVPEWYVLDRNYNETYAEYGQDSDRIANIGKVFPAIFFLVAALVALTTMTRMVEERRMEIGTMKALGYGNATIIGKYLWYAFLASFLGSLLGLYVGQKVLPYVIIKAYAILYNNVTVVVNPLSMVYSVSSTVIAILCTTLSTFFACYKELLEKPANLMRPAVPKTGKRVFLEHVPFIWKHLNFTQKATIRNLFRYKKRFFMTVFGIGGCMGLLLVGFGLKDSVTSIADLQFGELRTYNADIAINDDATDEEKTALRTFLEEDDRVAEFLGGYQAARDLEANGVVKNGYLVVPMDREQFTHFSTLRDRITHTEYALSDEGVIIDEKLAKLLSLSVGDMLTLKEDELNRVEVRVDGICENYFMHYVYMSPSLYEEVYGEPVEEIQYFLNNVSNEEEFEDHLGRELMDLPAVAGINFYSGMASRIKNMLHSLDLVTYVLVVSAGLLAFVVLYNLNNINITERRRELATLKVLGFYDGEVDSYVNRENVILTLIGCAVGCVIGFFLHRFVILTAEIDVMMFARDIHFVSYIYSMILTFVFAIIVAFVMHRKLMKIDMVESLKSVE